MQRQLGADQGSLGAARLAEAVEAVQQQELAGLPGQRRIGRCVQVDGDRAERRQDPPGMGD